MRELASTWRRFLLAATSGIALSAGIVALAHPAAAQDSPVSPELAQSVTTYDIPAQDLNAALLAFASRAGLQIFYDVQRVRGLRSAPLVGGFTPQQALTQLLTGTGIAYRFTGTNTVSLETPGTGSGATQLDPVRVQANAVPPQAMIDNLPPPYAGGLVAKGAQLGVLGNRDFMDTPFNQTSYTSKLMQDQQAQSIGDVLQNDPSVRIENSGSAGVQDFNIRGFNVANGDILFLGLLGVTPTFFNVMMTEGLERVDVLKGPAAFLNGAGPAGSVGGIINTIPKRAGNEPLTQVTPTYYSNSQVGGHVDFGRRFGPDNETGVRINAVYRKGNTPIDNQNQESRLFTLGLDHKADRFRASLDFGYQYQYLQSQRLFPNLAFGVPVPPAPKNTTNYDNPWEFNSSEVFYGAARGEYDIADNLTAFVSAGGSQRRQQQVGTFTTITNASGRLAPSNADISADVMYGASIESGVRATFDTGPVNHQATIAYNRFWREWRRANYNGFSEPASNIYNPIYGSAPSPAFIPSPDSARKRSENDLSSVAIGDTLSVWQERLQFTLGLRFQQINTWNFNTTTGAVTSSYNAAAATPMFGLLAKPWQNVSVYANYIQGLQQGPTAPLTAVNAGQVFPPSVTQQYEVGVKVDWGKLATTLAAYQITQPSGFINPQTNIFGVDGEQRNRGLEFNVFGEPTEGVRLLGGLSYIDARLTLTQGGLNQGNQAVGVSPFQLVAGGEWDLPFAKAFTVLGRVIYDSPAFVDRANLQQMPDWALVNLGVRYTFEGINKKPIVIRANVNNVFDANYWQATSFGQMSLSSPRTFLLSTSFNF
jgi:iron complex outermembrane recepter protein